MAKVANHGDDPTPHSPIVMTSATQARIEKMVGLGKGNFTATTCTKDDRIGQQRLTSKKKKDKSFHDCEDKNYEIRIENILCGSESEDEIILKGDTAARMNILCNVHGIEIFLCGSKSEDETILKGDTAARMNILCSVHHIEIILCGSRGEDEIILKGDAAARVNILCNVDENIPNDYHIGNILHGPKSANEDISNENHIENILCSSKNEAVDEGKDIKKHTHMTHKLDQWSSTPFGLNGFMENGKCRLYVALQSHGLSLRRCSSKCTHPQRSPLGRCLGAPKWQMDFCKLPNQLQ